MLLQMRQFCFTWNAYPAQMAFKQGLPFQVIVGMKMISPGVRWMLLFLI